MKQMHHQSTKKLFNWKKNIFLLPTGKMKDAFFRWSNKFNRRMDKSFTVKNIALKAVIIMSTLHKKWSFPLRISSANVTNSAINWSLMENFIFCMCLVFCYKNLAKARRLKAILKLLRGDVSYVLMDILLNS